MIVVKLSSRVALYQYQVTFRPNPVPAEALALLLNMPAEQNCWKVRRRIAIWRVLLSWNADVS